MKKIVCLLLSCIVLLSLTACDRNVTDIGVYEKFAAEDKIMPELDELGDYISVKSLYHYDSALFFEWKAYNLIVEYTEAAYESAKAAAEEKYVFETKMIESKQYIGGRRDTYDDDWKPVNYPPYCTVEGYRMQLLDDDAIHVMSFPKEAYLVGFNDEAHKIAYVYFDDIDLDVEDSLIRFLLDKCGWSVLIKRNML